LTNRALGRSRASVAKAALISATVLDLSAAGVTNQVGATSYWNNELYARTFDYLWQWAIDTRIVGALNTHVGLDADKVATTYLSNHDHSHVAWQGGARDLRSIGSLSTNGHGTSTDSCEKCMLVSQARVDLIA
jgi:hypothetical protein